MTGERRPWAEQIRAASAVSLTSDPSVEWSTNVLKRFVSWHEAMRVLHGRSGVNMKPALEEIREVACVRPQVDGMLDIVCVSSYYIIEWDKTP